ncbi:SDR family oxidoreductase [Sinorhizobium medicae]|uniref:SDR family oxidoreductase n=1 Tax=Sinorhizobium medicae TaxID=110321 RepID=UPI000404481A|nr:SDR family oxidoreductase [Sinorhizobium medicae]MDX0583770.1 SDR family oxidoreductase [Sinorhizobium medicae]RVQ77282.1 SDR family oxidoreductase [Sinorhizobium medicae]
MDCKRLQWQPLLLRQIDHRVDCVAPGPVETDFFLKGKTKEEIAARAAGAPAGRLGRPEDIADAIALLVSRKAQWISGQTLRANGGMA